jgi:hypothetical protein
VDPDLEAKRTNDDDSESPVIISSADSSETIPASPTVMLATVSKEEVSNADLAMMIKGLDAKFDAKFSDELATMKTNLSGDFDMMIKRLDAKFSGRVDNNKSSIEKIENQLSTYTTDINK